MLRHATLSLALAASLAVCAPAYALADPSPAPDSPTPTVPAGATTMPLSPRTPSNNPVDTSSPSSSSTGASPSRFIVTRAVSGTNGSGDDAIAAQAQAVGATVRELRPLASGDDVIIMDRHLDESSTRLFVDKAGSIAGVLRVEEDQRMQPVALTAARNPTAALSGLAQAHTVSSGRGATIAVIDTGFTKRGDVTTRGGHDFVSEPSLARDGDGRDADASDPGDASTSSDDCRAQDSSWHGTAMAGALTGSGGLDGVAPEATVVSVRALGKCGGYSSDIIDALLWSAGQPVLGTPANSTPARVIVLPVSATGSCSFSYQNAINQVAAKGVTVVAAVGGPAGQESTPANCANVIGVGATGASNSLAPYSGPVRSTGLLAPGGDASSGALTAGNTGLERPGQPATSARYGTAIAAARVAGAAALLTSANPQLTPGQVDQILQRSAKPLGCDGCGAGLLDIAAALAQAKGAPAGEPTSAPSQPTSGPTAPAADKARPESNLLVNGTFEAGASSWRGDTGAITAKHKQAASGRFKAWLLGYGRAGAEQISQPVAIPAGRKVATLSFALQITSDETKPYAYDKMVIRVFDWNGRYLGTLGTFSNVDKSNGYSVKILDMSQFIGQKIQIQFGAVEDRSLPTSFVLDDVTLTVS